MPDSSILQEVYDAHVENFGEPDGAWEFNDGTPREGHPDQVDVMVWRPTTECELTAFATIGMSERPLPGAKHRAELHFAIRAPLTPEQEDAFALFLANLAMYPFQTGKAVDWWQTIGKTSEIPLYTEAQSVLLHPKFVPEGWSKIETSEGEVRILNVVPITEAERALRTRERIGEALEDLDVFSPR